MSVKVERTPLTQFKIDVFSIICADDMKNHEKLVAIVGALKEYERASLVKEATKL